MRDDDVIMLLTFGVLVLGRKRVEWGAGWQWPLASVSVQSRVYRPRITDGFSSRRGVDIHGGVDVAFLRRDAKDLVQTFPPGSPSGGASWFAPSHVPVLAARAGRVWSVSKQPRGWEIHLDHGSPWVTEYMHIETPAIEPHANGYNVRTGQPTYVRAGDILGVMGFDPLDNERVRHLHFVVKNGGGRAEDAVDPEDDMAHWPYASLITPVS